MSTPESIDELSLPAVAHASLSAKSSENEREVLELYEQFRGPLLRYAISLGISLQDSEEVVQEVFLSLFQHLQQRKSRSNLRGWLFRVTHNLGLKQLYANQRSEAKVSSDESVEHLDPSPNPEEELSMAQRRHRLLAVVHALPQTDQCCLALRAEGFRYREIAAVLGMSLGAVSISLTRSLARLARADGR